MSLEAEVIEGEEAARILQSRVFIQSFDDVKAILLKQFEELPVDKTADIAEIHRRLKSLEMVKKVLSERISNGRMAQEKLSKMEKLGQFGKKALNAFARR